MEPLSAIEKRAVAEAPAIDKDLMREFWLGSVDGAPMTSGVVADSIVNMCGAIGLSVAMVALYRRDSRSPLTARLLLALGVVALLFLVRGAAWWTGSAWLDRVSMIPAALIPLGALIVTEGILRRHAPRAVKIAVVVGGIGLGLGGVLGMQGFSTLYSLSLSLFQLAGSRSAPGCWRQGIAPR